MRLFQARIRHVPRLLAILWAYRSGYWWSDVWIVLREAHLGGVTAVRDATGLLGFSLRKGPHLHALYVHPHARGRGVGRRLLDEAKMQTGALSLWVAQDNRAGRRFYCRHGFAEKRRSDGANHEDDLPEILMVWPPERRVEP